MEELEDKPESLRMRKLKELIEEMSMLVDAQEDVEEVEAPEMSMEESKSF